LKEIFYQTRNGVAADLLFSYQNPEETGMLREILSLSRSLVILPCSIPPSREDMLPIFTSAQTGNVYQLIPLMRGIAASCAGINIPWETQPLFDSINLSEYRMKLGKVLLNKRDAARKTLLHLSIDAKSAKK
jgi:hypothetical protein